MQSLETEPRSKREYNIGCILCKVHKKRRYTMYMYMYMYITNYNLLYLMNSCIDRPSQTQIVHKFLALV